MKSKKYEKKILEMYNDISPRKIRKTAYIHQKKLINNNQKEDNDYVDYQRKVISICIDKNPVAYLLGCLDAMEEELKEQKPDVMLLGSEFKDVLLKNDSNTSHDIFIDLSGAVDPITIQDLIKQYRSGDLSGDKFTSALEDAIEESWQDTVKKNKKYLK